MNGSLLIRNAIVITLDQSDAIFEGDVLIDGGRIADLGPSIKTKADEVIDARGRVLLPGFVQTHVHLCQTLFRGAADDLSLIDWLRRRLWPRFRRPTATRRAAGNRQGRPARRARGNRERDEREDRRP